MTRYQSNVIIKFGWKHGQEVGIYKLFSWPGGGGRTETDTIPLLVIKIQVSDTGALGLSIYFRNYAGNPVSGACAENWKQTGIRKRAIKAGKKSSLWNTVILLWIVQGSVATNISVLTRQNANTFFSPVNWWVVRCTVIWTGRPTVVYTCLLANMCLLLKHYA